MAERVKISFLYGGGSSASEVETLWAIRTPDGFRLDNIPFFAQGVADGDIVAATADAEGRLQFDSIVMPSGHSTVRLWFAKPLADEVVRVRHLLRSLGCPTELSDLPRLVAVDVPPSVSYDTVRALLDSLEREGVLEYEESCIGSDEP